MKILAKNLEEISAKILEPQNPIKHPHSITKNDSRSVVYKTSSHQISVTLSNTYTLKQVRTLGEGEEED